MAPAVATYEPRDPSHTVLYKVIADHLETFLASLDADPDAKGLPAYVERAFYDYLQCGILAHGFLRLGCDTCKHEMLLAFSCKRRGFCPSCAGRHMAQTAAHLVERVIPWVPTLQWVVSVRVIQFSGPAPVSLFPPPRRGRARVGVKAGGVPRPCFSPPSRPSPARGEGVEGPGRRGENRELNGPSLHPVSLAFVAGGVYPEADKVKGFL